MLCSNPKCRAPLKDHQWGAGYCSRHCMAAGLGRGERVDDMLHDPRTGAVVCRNRAEIEAMTDAYGIDPRLPRIIYLRRQGMTLRQVGDACGIAESTVRKLLRLCACNLLQRCGLRQK